MAADTTIDTVLMILAIGALALGLGSVALGFLVHQWDRLRVHMSSAVTDRGGDLSPENASDPRSSLVKGNGETAGNSVAIGEMTTNDPFPFPDLFTGLARLVLDKKIGETDAIRIAIKVTPGRGDKYQEARRRLHVAMERECPSDDPLFRQPDGSTVPATRPITGSRTHA